MASDRLRSNRDDKIVILDSNALMMLFEFSINLEDELTRLLGKFQIIIPNPIFDEIKYLSKHGKGKKKFIAKPTLDIIKKYKIVDVEGNADDSVLILAKKLNGIVLTNDREIRKRAKEASLHNIFLRGKNQLLLE
jgi:rRNA-processing protein FCF1